MTIPFEELKARLLADCSVKAEYEAAAPEFEVRAMSEAVRSRASANDLMPGRERSQHRK